MISKLTLIPAIRCHEFGGGVFYGILMKDGVGAPMGSHKHWLARAAICGNYGHALSRTAEFAEIPVCISFAKGAVAPSTRGVWRTGWSDANPDSTNWPASRLAFGDAAQELCVQLGEAPGPEFCPRNNGLTMAALAATSPDVGAASHLHGITCSDVTTGMQLGQIPGRPDPDLAPIHSTAANHWVAGTAWT